MSRVGQAHKVYLTEVPLEVARGWKPAHRCEPQTVKPVTRSLWQNLLHSHTPRPALGPILPPVHWVPLYFPDVKRPVRDGDQPSRSGAEVKNDRCYTSVVPIFLHGLHTEHFTFTLPFFVGTAVTQWLRCCAANRNVAGSIPAGVSGFFNDIKSFWSHYGPGVDSASNRNKYQKYFLGVKAAGA